MARKICPLKFNSKTLDTSRNMGAGELLCEGANCAFWDEPEECCSLVLPGRKIAYEFEADREARRG